MSAYIPQSIRITLLTNILPRGVERVEMVEVGERAEELLRAVHLVTDDHPALARALDFEDLNDRSETLLDIPHNALVDLERVLACFLQEDGVRNSTDVCLPVSSTLSACSLTAMRKKAHSSVRLDFGGSAGKLHLLTK